MTGLPLDSVVFGTAVDEIVINEAGFDAADDRVISLFDGDTS